MEFGLLNQDCLWTLDEIQLMDVGLATTAQLQAFRRDDQRLSMVCRDWRRLYEARAPELLRARIG